LGAFDLPQNGPDDKGIELVAESIIDNPANNTLELGNVRFVINLSSDNFQKPAPIAWIQGAVALKPGKNTLKMKGLVLPSEEDVPALEEFFNNYLHGQVSKTVITAGKVEGAEAISWVENSMKSFSVKIDFPGHVGESLVKDVLIEENEVLMEDKKNRFELGSTNLVTMNPPFAFPMVVKEVKMNVEVFDPDSEDKTWFAKWDTDWLEAEPQEDGVSTRVKVARKSIAEMVCGEGVTSCSEYGADNEHVVAFKNNAKKVMKAMGAKKTSTSLGMRGTNDVKLETAAGTITLTDIPIDVTTEVSLKSNKLLDPKKF
jgi:hypothetical protein